MTYSDAATIGTASCIDYTHSHCECGSGVGVPEAEITSGEQPAAVE